MFDQNRKLTRKNSYHADLTIHWIIDQLQITCNIESYPKTAKLMFLFVLLPQSGKSNFPF